MFSRLHIYTVHLKPEAKSGERMHFIAEGFSWFAFVFSTLWLLYHRLWLAAGGVIAANVLIALAAERAGLDVVTVSVMQLGLQLWIGFHANDLLRHKLKKQGYITYAIASGDNLIRAQQRFFDRHADVIADA